MPIVAVDVTEDDVLNTLSLEEGHFVDLKAIEVGPGKLTKGLSASANADGGELFVGIDEDKVSGSRTWRGFANVEAANGHVQVFEQLFPLGQDFIYEFLAPPDASKGLVLHISIQKTREIKLASDGIPYVRRGAQSLPVKTPEEVERLNRNKGITSFETSTVSVPVDFVSNSEVIIGFMLAVVPIADPLPWLRSNFSLLKASRRLLPYFCSPTSLRQPFQSGRRSKSTDTRRLTLRAPERIWRSIH